MKLPTFSLSPAWARFLAAALIFLVWFVLILTQPPVKPGAQPLLDPAQFVSYIRYLLVGIVGYHAGDKTMDMQSLRMRLIAGTGLLFMWAWLVIVRIAPPHDLVDAMAIALFTLGVMPGNPAALGAPAAPPSIPPLAQPAAIPRGDSAPQQPSQPE